MAQLKAALFLDRDGVMNEDTAYAHGEHPITLVPGIVDIFKFLKKHPIFLPVVVSNQSGIGRGIYKEQDFMVYTQRLIDTICEESEYTEVIPVYFCPAYDTESFELKPKPGMLLKAANEQGLVLRESYIIGDHHSDLTAGANASCRGLLHRSPGVNVFDLFKCIPEVKYLLETNNKSGDFIH